MFQKIVKHPLLRGYLRLPLWSKIAIPLGAFLLVTIVLLPLFKVGMLIAVVGVVAYLVMSMAKRA